MSNILASIDGTHSQAADNSHILIIEDDEDSGDLLKVILEMKGYDVLMVEDGEQCLALTQETPPDLIIMNVTFPIDQGLAMLHRIQNHAFLRNVPIIVTSGYAVPGFQSEILQAGSKAFFAKPIDFEDLGNVIQRHLSH